MAGFRLVFSLLLFALLPCTAIAGDGPELYQRHCALCHGAAGQGVPGAFPPLAASDFLVKDRERALRAPMEGLFGRIEVNGHTYNGGMPPVALNDEQLTAVFEFVFLSWGNSGNPPNREEIAATRAKTKFPTYEALVAAVGASSLPAPPEGWELRVGVDLGFFPVRLAAHPDGERVLVLADNGDVWSCKLDGSELVRLLQGTAYIDPSLGRPSVLGFTVDRNRRLYLVCNQRNEKVNPVRNEITIFRTAAWSSGQSWGRPEPWFRTSYPWGVGPYNHGVSHIAQGPDGFLYVNSGSRTDGGEAGTLPNYAKTGEEPITACMWRLDPRDERPVIEVIARGLRNSYGFSWDDEGRLLATENGPDADLAEELNVIEAGKHYGFPFQYADSDSKAYPHTPDLPAGLKITRPLRNLGPDGVIGGGPASTFDPHSCPSGIVWIGPEWPAPFGGSFLTVRFGNLLKLSTDVGFDLLQLKPNFTAATTTCRRVLDALGRPIDLLKMPGHRLVIAEYSRGTTLAAGLGTPGRLLVLEPKRN